MKNLFVIIAAMLVASGAFALEDRLTIPVEDNAAGSTNVVTDSHRFVGTLESIFIDIVAGSTNTITVSTPSETLLTATDVIADAVYAVRYPVSNAAGAAISDVYTKRVLANEKITVTIVSGSVAANTVKVEVKTTSKK
jgi:hypothetical protein